MNAHATTTEKKSNFLQTLKAELRVLVHFAYVAKKVFLF